VHDLDAAIALASVRVVARRDGHGLAEPLHQRGLHASFRELARDLVGARERGGLIVREPEEQELRAGPGRLQLAAVGEVSALDEAQTRSLRGPRADPAAFLVIRPYLRRAVYVAVARPGGESRRGHRRLRLRGFRPRVELVNPVVDSPYWLVSTRHPAELAAAIERARPAARAGGATMG